MNKILIDNEKINLLESDDKIVLSLSDKLDIFDVTKVKLEILSSTKVEIIYKEKTKTKIDFKIISNENTNLDILEINESNESKIKYEYILKEKSKINIIKINDTNKTRELDIIQLDGEKAEFNSSFKTIAHDEHKIDYYVYHNSSNTISNINNKGVTIDNGSIYFHVTSIVYSNVVGCNINQYQRIINTNKGNCHIDPILLIEENDVVANHSAYIGTFDEDELFYLKTRGIDDLSAKNLLIRGFLMEESNEKIESIVNKYWR